MEGSRAIAIGIFCFVIFVLLVVGLWSSFLPSDFDNRHDEEENQEEILGKEE